MFIDNIIEVMWIGRKWTKIKIKVEDKIHINVWEIYYSVKEFKNDSLKHEI